MMRRHATTAARFPEVSVFVLTHLRRNAVAYLALFISLSGTAYAANTVRTGDIVDGEVRAADLGTMPHIVVGDTGSNQSMSTGVDSAVRFNGTPTSSSSVTRSDNNTRFSVPQSGTYVLTSHIRTKVNSLCGLDHCGGYAIAKLVRYAGGTGNPITLATDQVAIITDTSSSTLVLTSDVQPVVVAKLNAGDKVAVLVAASMTSGTTTNTFTVPTETASLQPHFSMHFLAK